MENTTEEKELNWRGCPSHKRGHYCLKPLGHWPDEHTNDAWGLRWANKHPVLVPGAFYERYDGQAFRAVGEGTDERGTPVAVYRELDCQQLRVLPLSEFFGTIQYEDNVYYHFKMVWT